jgi:hypothetical protein
MIRENWVFIDTVKLERVMEYAAGRQFERTLEGNDV